MSSTFLHLLRGLSVVTFAAALTWVYREPLFLAPAVLFTVLFTAATHEQ